MRSHAQVIINALLTMDGYLVVYRIAMKPMEFLGQDEAVKESHAFDLVCGMIDYCEILERVAKRKHKSWYPHVCLYRWGQWILEKGDIWAVHMSALELLNAETKRTAESNGSKCLERRAHGFAQHGPLKVGANGPVRLVETKGYGGSLSESVMTHMAAKQAQRRSLTGVRTRVSERLFGVVRRLGRVTLARFGIKHDACADIDPRSDTCIRAFVRLAKLRLESGDITWKSPATVR